MNTKVEEALGVLEGAERSFVVLQQLVVMVNANADYIAAANEVRTARTTLAAHIAQQDATIARLSELVRAVKSSDYEISCDDVSTGNWFDARTALIATLNQGEVK